MRASTGNALLWIKAAGLVASGFLMLLLVLLQ